jgi:hypothetical protein
MACAHVLWWMPPIVELEPGERTHMAGVGSCSNFLQRMVVLTTCLSLLHQPLSPFPSNDLEGTTSNSSWPSNHYGRNVATL